MADPADPGTPPPARMEAGAAAFQARCLLRGAASATLATQQEGQPFASLVTPAMAPDLTPLLLISSLSEHTRQLRRPERIVVMNFPRQAPQRHRFASRRTKRDPVPLVIVP